MIKPTIRYWWPATRSGFVGERRMRKKIVKDENGEDEEDEEGEKNKEMDEEIDKEIKS